MNLDLAIIAIVVVAVAIAIMYMRGVIGDTVKTGASLIEKAEDGYFGIVNRGADAVESVGSAAGSAVETVYKDVRSIFVKAGGWIGSTVGGIFGKKKAKNKQTPERTVIPMTRDEINRKNAATTALKMNPQLIGYPPELKEKILRDSKLTWKTL